MRKHGVTVAFEPWAPHPLVWIHRAEAHAIADELERAGLNVRRVCLAERNVDSVRSVRVLLRVSDPRMLGLTAALSRQAMSYIGPGAEVVARCYDKFHATVSVSAAGIDIPATSLGSEGLRSDAPRILKPRRGSDSIGVRRLGRRPIPASRRTTEHLVQAQIFGTELTIAFIRGKLGAPLRIELPPGVPYSFLRKYVQRPARSTIADDALAQRIRALAARVAEILGADWAARIDLIHETSSDRLVFLECDAAPLIGVGSAFAESLSAAGIARAEQLRLLLSDARDEGASLGHP